MSNKQKSIRHLENQIFAIRESGLTSEQHQEQLYDLAHGQDELPKDSYKRLINLLNEIEQDHNSKLYRINQTLIAEIAEAEQKLNRALRVMKFAFQKLPVTCDTAEPVNVLLLVKDGLEPVRENLRATKDKALHTPMALLSTPVNPKPKSFEDFSDIPF